jgi:hypothetical protein
MLSEIPEGYQIFKLCRRGGTICEYALCHFCHADAVREFSGESRARLAEFHERRVSLDLGRHACAVCGDARSEVSSGEFALTGACRGLRLVHELMICGGCHREMQSLLSRESRGVWDRFVNENLPGVPAGAALPGGLLPV